jgi:N6-L-threonylcarbamoyladenine synthase
MLILGIESSCDETGVALVDASAAATQAGVPRLLAHALHSQIAMHQAYGGVVPELASRDHIRRVLPLSTEVLARAGRSLAEVDLVAFTRGPGLAGALLVGAGVAVAMGAALGKPVHSESANCSATHAMAALLASGKCCAKRAASTIGAT